jgi:hypothetical protein
MATCSNCNRNLSCGCQKKVASDGKSACGTCITQYESNLTKKVLSPQYHTTTTKTATPSQLWAARNIKK